MIHMRNANRALKITVFLVFGLLLTGLPVLWKELRQAKVAAHLPVPQRGMDQRRLVSALAKLPASFEPNRGQADPSVKYLSRGPGYALFLRPSEAVLSLPSPSSHSSQQHSGQAYRALRLKILNSSLSGKIEGQDLLSHRSNYFLGNRPERQHVGVPNFSRVRYKSVYPGIDMVFHGDPSQLEFDLDVAPGADVHHVRLRLEGTDGIRLDGSGDLIARLDSAELRLRRPVAYQHFSGGDRLVPGRFTLASNQEIGFRMDNYDASLPLVIDPVLTYSTFVGGTGADQALAVAVDSQGDFYVTGQTASSNFPVVGALQGTYGGITDAFVAKFKADGSGLAYSTYLGGSFLDIAQAIAVDSQGNAYVTGFTSSADFPTKNPIQATLNGNLNQDLFITKLSPDGSSLVYSTYLGGSNLDTIAAIAVNAQNEVVLAGTTKSTDFPLVNALETNLHGTSGNSDAFVAKIKADGSGLVFSTYLGGAGVDGATGVAVDSQGNIVVSGGTNSTDFPTVNALQPTFGGGITTNIISADAFLTKLKGDGSAIIFSTYWGGSSSDQGAYLSLDANDNIFLVGETNSADFPTLNPYQAKPGSTGITGFVTKFMPDGSAVLFSTYWGGSGNDFIYGSAVDPNGNVYVSGNTSSTDLPLAKPLQSTYGGGASDGFVSELSGNGSTLLFSTYLGGSNTDGFDRMTADRNGIYVVGSTTSSDFPTAGLPVSQYMGGGDGVVVKITNASLVFLSISSLSFADQIVGTTSASQPVTLTNAGNIALNITNLSISPDYGQTNNCGSSLAAGKNCTFNITFTPTASGSRPGSLTITDNASGSPQTVSLTGTGTAPVAGVSTGTLTFGNQAVGTSSTSQPITLSNTGSAPLTIDSFSTSGDFSQTNNCGSSVAASASCTFNVTFTPTASGTRTGVLTIADNASGSPQTVSLSGTGTGPVVSLSPPLTFSSQLVGTTSNSQTVTLTNAGNGSLTFSAIAATAPFAIATSGTTCSTSNTVAAAGTCTVAVTFTPTAASSASGSLSFSDNAPNTPHTVALSGTGQDFSFAPPSGSSTSATAAPGQTANYTLSVGGEGGLSGAVTFTCTGAPSEAICTVSPNPATAGSSATNVTVSVTTTAPSASAPRSRPLPPVPPLSPGLRGLLMLALALVAMGWAIVRRNQPGVSRWQSTIVPLAAGLLLTLGLAGCGGGGGGVGGTTSNRGTPAGTYTLTVTGTTGSGSSALSHSVTLTLTVS